MRNIFLLVVFAILCYTSFVYAAGGVLPGSGTEGDPYLIEDLADFDEFADADNAEKYWSEGVYTKLVTDLDLSGRVYGKSVIAPDTNNMNWEFNDTVFAGVFDGNSHIISNLNIEGADYCGLFGVIGSDGTVANLGLENIEVTGEDYVGGLCGENSGSISGCYASGTITGDDHIGGLCGINSGSIGGCYASGTITGDDHIGGLCGINSGSISGCYASGTITGDYAIGGLCGINSGSIILSFWNIDSSGQEESAGGWGLTDEQMKQAGSFYGWTDSSWTIDEGKDYPHLVWENADGTIINIGYPEAAYNGEGTEDAPFEISKVDDLLSLMYRDQDWDKYFVLTNDIDLGGMELFNPVIGYGYEFSGIFDGGGYTISNFIIYAPIQDYVGFFSKLSPAAQIRDLGLENTEVTGDGYVGGLCGSNSGSISGCYASGMVTGDYVTGGLCGINSDSISGCYASGTITGDDHIGGLCGINSGSIGGCYASGTITGDDHIGGLCGINSGSIILSFWNIDSSGQEESAGGWGLTDEQMKQAGSFYGWTDSSWTIDEGKDYPHLVWENADGTIINIGYPEAAYNGEGTEDAPFEISKVDDLLSLMYRDQDWDKYFVLTNDIDLGGMELFNPVIGYGYEFSGIFDGGGYTISNFIIYAPIQDYVGFFSKLSPAAQIRDLGLENTEVTGDGYVGGLCGSNSGSISGCYASGMVTGDYVTGGLCGINSDSISGCYASGMVTGEYDTGGLCGINSGSISCYASSSVAGDNDTGGLCSLYLLGSISSCYASCTVTGEDFVGGLCGSNSGSISGCYASGLVTGYYFFVGGLVGNNINLMGDNINYVSSMLNNFWDIDSSGVTDHETGIEDTDGMVGITTSEMLDINTYLDADWGISFFVQSGDDWIIREGQYPILAWESYKYAEMKPECKITVDRVLVKSGRTKAVPQDSIVLNASSFYVPLELLKGVMSFSIYSGSEMRHVHTQTIYFSDNSSQKYRIKNGSSTYKFDLNNNTFQFSGKNLDLTGLCSPITMVLENELCTISGVAYDGGVLGSGGDIDVINGKKSMPVELMLGVEDVLTVDKVSYKAGKKAGTDSLKVQGSIVVKDADVDISAKDVVITYGDYSVTLKAEDIFSQGAKKVYKYKSAKGSTAERVTAMIDLEKCKYTISISKASIGEQGSAASFGISFGEFDEGI